MSIITDVSEKEMDAMSGQGDRFLVLYSTKISEGIFKYRVILFTKRYNYDPFTKTLEFLTPKKNPTECLTTLNTAFSKKSEDELIPFIGDLGLTLSISEDKIGLDLLKDVYKDFRKARMGWTKLIDHLKKQHQKK